MFLSPPQAVSSTWFHCYIQFIDPFPLALCRRPFYHSHFKGAVKAPNNSLPRLQPFPLHYSTKQRNEPRNAKKVRDHKREESK